MSKTFKQAVNHIKEAERDVDTVLDAAKLQRNPTDNGRLEMILNTVLAIVGILSALAAFLGMLFISTMR